MLLKRMKWSLGGAFLLFLVLISVPVMASTTWQQTGGPLGGGGYILALAIDSTNSQNIYAGTLGGGVYKSTNGGGSWGPVNSGLTNLYVYSLAIDPKNSQTVYAGTEGGVYKSTNGGGLWSPAIIGLTHLVNNIQTPYTVNALAIDPGNTQNIR